MTVTPPTIGQEDWGDDLNTYLIDLEKRIADNVQRITLLEQDVADAQDDILALQTKPDYVYNSYAWQFNNGAPPATGNPKNEIRLNNADPALATVIDVRKLDFDGADRTPIFQQLGVGAKIRINDWDDAALLHRYTVTGTPTMDATNVQIPVIWLSGSGTLPNNTKVTVGLLVSLIV